MIILGIETSCDETAVSIVQVAENRITILSNIVSSQVAMHARFGGVVPSLAAREHAVNIGPVFEQALHEASGTGDQKLLAESFNLIAVTRGPGLGPALLVGLTFARTLAWQLHVPIIGVNHLDGHVHSNWLPQETGDVEVVFPALNLIVSGGHTELVLMRSHTDYEIIGETLDDAVGEAFDKVARLMDLGYPGGPQISAYAQNGNPSAYALPRPMLKSNDYNFSYSGLKTAVLYSIRDTTTGTRELSKKEKEDIAASFQDAAIDVLIQKTERAIRNYHAKSILLSGGVSANKLLRDKFQKLGTLLDIPCRIPSIQYTGDNAAMIAVAGYFAWCAHSPVEPSWKTLSMDANLRLGQS